jgi:hypothetical protein
MIFNSLILLINIDSYIFNIAIKKYLCAGQKIILASTLNTMLVSQGITSKKHASRDVSEKKGPGAISEETVGSGSCSLVLIKDKIL